MGINFGGFGAGVIQDFLDVSQVDALLKKVGGKTVPQGMWCGMLINLCLFQCFSEDIRNTGSTVLSTALPFKQPVFWFVISIVIS